ncbi:MAG: hypothetical protein EKK47_13205 [Burkholderiales bacterium]|jgi:hypothetical protein|nr:MAG: hypothetical protein EKK47_13205 [Burkholderiales bacterium]
MDDLKATRLIPLMREHISPEARVMTDDAGQYNSVGKYFADHGFTRHGQGEYVSKVDAPSTPTPSKVSSRCSSAA